MVFNKLQKIQRGLSTDYQTENSLRDQVINACRGVPECSLALYKPSDSFEGVCAELRSAVGTAVRAHKEQQFSTYSEQNKDNEPEQLWTDRQYIGQGRSYRGQSRSRYRGNFHGGLGRGYTSNRPFQQQQKKCYICNKPGCWLTKYSSKE